MIDLLDIIDKQLERLQYLFTEGYLIEEQYIKLIEPLQQALLEMAKNENNKRSEIGL
jgi:hypothetical protein